MIRKIFFLIIISFSFCPLYAMNVIELSMFNEIELNSPRTPLLSLNHLGDKEDEIKNNTHCFSFLSTLSNFWNVFYKERETKEENLLNIKNIKINIIVLPDEIFLILSNFLSSMDILKLSGVCKKFHQLFDDSYWVSYFSNKPIVCSQLTLHNPLLPSRRRKDFFSHLWYIENRIDLAARLNHPEGIILSEYGQYGVYIDNDQYLCPSGVIRYASGQIDVVTTNLLREAKAKKDEDFLRKQEAMQRINENLENNYLWDCNY